MTENDVRAAAERLVEFHERFAPLFGKEQAQDHAYTYVKGLMVCPERKSIEPIAIHVGDGGVPIATEQKTTIFQASRSHKRSFSRGPKHLRRDHSILRDLGSR